MSIPNPDRRSTAWAVALVVVLLCGAGLRLVWVSDMEYKADERWFFQQSQPAQRDGLFPWLGLPSSTFALNPGSVAWPFAVLGGLLGVDEPTQMARAVQVLNILALVGLVVFALRVVPEGEREPWLWAAALLAVNPIAVLMHRKIWNVSVLLPITLLVLIGWWHRERRWGCFLWGLASLMVAWVYPPGLFFAAGLALWGLLFDRKKIAWLDWVLGSGLGAAPLVPWVLHLIDFTSHYHLAGRGLNKLVALPFYRYWNTEPFGISLNYSLDSEFWTFLRGPHLFGWPTYLVGALHVAMLALMVGILVGWVAWYFRTRPALGRLFVGSETETGFLQSAYVWGGGLLLTLAMIPVHRHSMQLVAPIMFLWLARLALRNGSPLRGVGTVGRGLLAALVVVQLTISASFLGFVHTHDGPIQGDYGTPYSQQVSPGLRAQVQEKAR
jgi:hypothetical protein